MDPSPGRIKGLFDIEPPPPPPEPVWTSLALVALLAGAVVLAVWLLRRRCRSPRARARRRLRALQRACQGDGMDPRAAVFSIAAIVRDGLGLRRLPGAGAGGGSASGPRGWQRFLHRLERERFGPGPTDQEEVVGLLHEADHWLARRS